MSSAPPSSRAEGTAKRGDVIEIKTLISPTSWRQASATAPKGKSIPRDISESFRGTIMARRFLHALFPEMRRTRSHLYSRSPRQRHHRVPLGMRQRFSLTEKKEAKLGGGGFPLSFAREKTGDPVDARRLPGRPAVAGGMTIAEARLFLHATPLRNPARRTPLRLRGQRAPATRAMQRRDTANPATLSVLERLRRLWKRNRRRTKAAPTCHGTRRTSTARRVGALSGVQPAKGPARSTSEQSKNQRSPHRVSRRPAPLAHERPRHLPGADGFIGAVGAACRSRS